MKRLRLKLVGPLVSLDEIKAELIESKDGELVKFEPWMEEVEPIHIHFPDQLKTLVQKLIPVLKTLYLMPGQQNYNEPPFEPKKPTICAECEYPLSGWFCGTNQKLDVVTGQSYGESCYHKNHGNCPDFKEKENV